MGASKAAHSPQMGAQTAQVSQGRLKSGTGVTDTHRVLPTAGRHGQSLGGAEGAETVSAASAVMAGHLFAVFELLFLGGSAAEGDSASRAIDQLSVRLPVRGPGHVLNPFCTREGFDAEDNISSERITIGK